MSTFSSQPRLAVRVRELFFTLRNYLMDFLIGIIRINLRNKPFSPIVARAGFISLVDGSRQFSICTGNFLIKLNMRGWLLLLRNTPEEE